MTISTAQALVRQAMVALKADPEVVLLEAHPEYWDIESAYSFMGCRFFGFVEMLSNGGDPGKDFPSFNTSTQAAVAKLLGLTELVAAKWAGVDSEEGVKILEFFETLFSEPLRLLPCALKSYDGDSLAIIASRPDLTLDICAQITEISDAWDHREQCGHDFIEVVALNPNAPIGALAALARERSLKHVRMLADNPAIICSEDVLYRMWEEVALNPNVPPEVLADIFPIAPVAIA